jgi:replicative DNA helicase
MILKYDDVKIYDSPNIIIITIRLEHRTFKRQWILLAFIVDYIAC